MDEVNGYETSDHIFRLLIVPKLSQNLGERPFFHYSDNKHLPLTLTGGKVEQFTGDFLTFYTPIYILYFESRRIYKYI